VRRDAPYKICDRTEENKDMEIDWRIVAVLSPVILAASWALFNIGAAALRQVQAFLNK